MKFVFRKIMKCKDDFCAENFLEKIETLLETKDHNQFHLSISHVPNDHKIWLFLYDKNGQHESERRGKTVIKKASNIKKFKGNKPSLTQLHHL